MTVEQLVELWAATMACWMVVLTGALMAEYLADWWGWTKAVRWAAAKAAS